MARLLILGSLACALLGACLPSDQCQRDTALCMKHCNQEPVQARDDPAVRFDPNTKFRPENDARSSCERACQRCRKNDPAPQSKPPTPTGY